MIEQPALKGEDLKAFFLKDKDLRSLVPDRPVLPAEVLPMNLSSDRVILYGGFDPVVLRSQSGAARISTLLRQFDGELSSDSILKGDGGEDRLEMLVALTRAGLFEDGAAEGDGDPLTAHIGRYLGFMDCRRNRAAVRRDVASQRLGVVSNLPDSVLREALPDDAFAEVWTSPSAVGPEGETADQMVFFLNGGDDSGIEQAVREAHDRGIPYLVVRLGKDVCDIGPNVIPTATAGYDCLRRTYDAPEGQGSGPRLAYWLNVAMHLAVNQAARLSHGYYNRFIRCRNLPGAPAELFRIPLVPGSFTSGLEADEAYERDADLRTVWLHHCCTRRLPRSAMSERTHLNHLSGTNIALTRSIQSSVAQFYRGPIVPLPPTSLDAVEGRFDASAAVRRAEAVTIQTLSDILWSLGGYGEVDGAQRRIAPTGGGLQSPSFYLLVRDVEGLSPGLYRYNGHDHAIEFAGHLRPDLAELSLGRPSGAQATVFFIAAIGQIRIKYDDFGYSICHYDAGVAMSFLHTVADALGVRVEEASQFDRAVAADALGIAHNNFEHVPTFAFDLGEPAEDGPLGQIRPITDLLKKVTRPRPPRVARGADGGFAPLDGFPSRSIGEVLRARRSVNVFDGGALDGEVVRGLVAIAMREHQRAQAEGGVPLRIRPLLLRARGTDDLPAGVYFGGEQPGTLERYGDREIGGEELLDCVSQLGLATASDVMVMIADLRGAVLDHGLAGYPAMLSRAGAMAGRTWLAANSAGLVCTAAGGVLEPGFIELAGCDGYRDCPLLSMAFGERKLILQ